MNDKSHETWERFLDPEVLRPSLMLASIYIATYEILKESIINRPKELFVTGFDEAGFLIDKKYQEEVLSRNKNLVYASLDWLREAGAIANSDIEIFNKVKRRRNDIAHEISRMLSEGLPKDFADCFNNMVSLLDKIERWWVINYEIPLSSEFDGKEVIEEEIIPGRIAGLRMMIDVALGADEESKFYINEFRKNFPKTDSPS
jgi:hypothetical protein